MTKTTKGCLWMAGPFLAIFLVLVTWSIVSFVIGTLATTSGGDTTGLASVARLINVGLGFIGILSVMAIPVGFIVGIVMMTKKDEMPSNVPPVVPPTTPPSDTPNMMQ